MMNYKHPEWKKEDAQFVNSLIKDMEKFQGLAEKYAFNAPLRIKANVIIVNLKDLIINLKEQYKEAYA